MFALTPYCLHISGLDIYNLDLEKRSRVTNLTLFCHTVVLLLSGFVPHQITVRILNSHRRLSTGDLHHLVVMTCKVLFVEMYVNVVFAMSCLYSTASLTLVRVD